MYIAYGLASWGEVKCRQIAASLPLGQLETDKGNQTYWGLGLAAAVSEHNIGDHIKLSDMGSKSVVVSIKEDDGTIKEVAGYRREWKSEREQPDQDVDYGPTVD